MCHVLIIEDEAFVALDLETLLASAGATSFSFSQTQSDAVAMALARAPRFITADVCLSEGTGPLAVCDIHDALGHIPVVYITGTPLACNPRDPADPVLTKPFDCKAVLNAFKIALLWKGA